MKYLLVSVLLSPFIIATSFGAAKYNCETQIDSSRAVFAKGTLSFIDLVINDTRTLLNITADIVADWSEIEDEVSEYAYTGSFKIMELKENKNYRPNKYKNHSQFPNFDATSTDMWGELVIENNPNDSQSLNAHYIFYAGDHIGGVIDFKCTKQ